MEPDSYPAGMPGLVAVVQELSLTRDLAGVQDITRRAARALTGADGATFILQDGPDCFYVDEDAIAPLWKGRRFPLDHCISGWSIIHRAPVVIEDIYADDRIPQDAYRPTFVQSLAMVPIRSADPLGAIGNYWARRHGPTEEEVALLQALADSTAVAMENVRMLAELEERVQQRTTELATRTREAEALAAELAGEVQSRRHAEEAVRRLSLTDELTGLANRRGFLLRAGQALAQDLRAGVTSSLLFIDLDGLKPVNDKLGHAAGDELIREAAGVLTTVLRQQDVIARWGGDEFVAFLPGVNDDAEVERRIMHQVRAVNRGRSEAPLSLSIGAARTQPGDPQPLRALIDAADRAMYRRKRRGGHTALVDA